MPSYMKEENSTFSTHQHILLAEDDKDDQELLKEAFSKVDPSCLLHIEANGRNALTYLETLSDNALPGIIILDYNMPELNGSQVLEKLDASPRYRSIPKVILSTSDNIKYVEESLEKGALAYRVKPYDFTGLLAIAREMIYLSRNVA